MNFESIEFLVFLLAVLAVYRIFPQRLRWFVLLCACFAFCGLYSSTLLLTLLATVLVSYVFARKAETAYGKTAKTVYTVIPILFSVGLLFAFKYFDVFFGKITTLGLVAPLGISFTALRAVSYAVEVYRGNMKAEKHIGYFALYIMFFPTLICGPLEKPDKIISEFRERKYFAPFDTAYGLKMLAIGFFKVLAVSKQIAVCVDTVNLKENFGNAVTVNGFTVLLSAVMFAFQMYCDFSGYCDIATGCAALMGIKLEKNYDSPYSSVGIRRFSESWNITLYKWFNEYVYSPLCGQNCGKIRKYVSLAFTYVLAGLWYGAGFKFVLFGAVWFVAVMLCTLTDTARSELREKLGSKAKYAVKFVKRLGTFSFVCFSLMLFRATDLKSFGALFGKLFTGWGGINALSSIDAVGFSPITLASALMGMLAVYLIDSRFNNGKVTTDKGISVYGVQSYIIICWTVALALIMLLTSGNTDAYRYFVF